MTTAAGYVFLLVLSPAISLYIVDGRFTILLSMGLPLDAQFAEPQHEAAFFYGLFLRGHPLQKLREDIDVSPQILERWNREVHRSPWVRPTIERILSYRKDVLAIFDSLVFKEMEPSERIQ